MKCTDHCVFMFSRLREGVKQSLGLSDRKDDVEFETLKSQFEKLDAHFIALYAAVQGYLEGVREMLDRTGGISEVPLSILRREILLRVAVAPGVDAHFQVPRRDAVPGNDEQYRCVLYDVISRV